MPEDIEKKIPGAEAPRLEAEPVPEKEKPAAIESPAVKEKMPTEPAPSIPVPSAAPSVPTPARDALTESVEMILSEDLGDFYRSMKPAERARFKAKGEETVSKVRSLLNGATVKAKEILGLIVSWIRMIPGLNKFFLEQESKIKTDKIIELHRRIHGG